MHTAADINSGNYEIKWCSMSFTMKFDAFEIGHEDLVELLIKYGGDINAQDNNLQTPIFKSVPRGLWWFKILRRALTSFALPDNSKMVEYLLEHGADVNHADNRNETALHIAVTWGTDIRSIIFFRLWRFKELILYKKCFRST